jgi:hypothetical protein
MATSIAFGLGFATLLVLLVIPSLLSIHETIAAFVGAGVDRSHEDSRRSSASGYPESTRRRHSDSPSPMGRGPG